MSLRTSPPVSQSTGLRKWLRFARLSHLPLGWLSAWFGKKAARSQKPEPPRPLLEELEARAVCNDLFGFLRNQALYESASRAGQVLLPGQMFLGEAMAPRAEQAEPLPPEPGAIHATDIRPEQADSFFAEAIRQVTEPTTTPDAPAREGDEDRGQEEPSPLSESPVQYVMATAALEAPVEEAPLEEAGEEGTPGSNSGPTLEVPPGSTSGEPSATAPQGNLPGTNGSTPPATPPGGDGSNQVARNGGFSSATTSSAAAATTSSAAAGTTAGVASAETGEGPAGGGGITATLPGNGTPRPQWLRDNGSGLPLIFEENVGQTDPSVDFLSRGRGYNLFLQDHGATLVLNKNLSVAEALNGRTPIEQEVIRLKIEGASPDAKAAGLEDLHSRGNYFTGAGPESWHTDIAHYGRVEYQNVYRGVDLAYYGTDQQQLEFDFIVRPGGDYRQIELSFDGIAAMRADANGDLILTTRSGEVVQKAPVVYQKSRADANVREAVQSSYEIKGPNRVGFNIGSFDATRTLYVDPILSFGTYLGGSGEDYGLDIAVDGSGNTYLVGATTSADFPGAVGTHNGNLDVFVTKLNAAGDQISYTTYVGGPGDEQGVAIALDAAGNAYVTGATTSAAFPTTPGAYQTALKGLQDPFAFKLNGTGSALIYSTLIGGTELLADEAAGIAVNNQGEATLVGHTDAADYATTAGVVQAALRGGIDVWAARLNGTGTATPFLTYHGGDYDDYGRDVALDNGGDVYFAGETFEDHFTPPPGAAFYPTTPGAFQAAAPGGYSDGFVTKLSSDGTQRLYSTYVGGSDDDGLYGIDVDPFGQAYVTGQITSLDYPLLNAFDSTLTGWQDAAVTKLDAPGSAAVFSSYLGGNGGYQVGNGIAVNDADGSAWVAGTTDAADFPLANPTQGALGGWSDAFVTQVGPSGGSLLFSSYAGGTDWEEGNGIAVDAAGDAYLIGSTGSTDLPAYRPYQGNNAGGTDAFVLKFSDTPAPAVIDAISADTGSSGTDRITTDTTLLLSGTALASAAVTLYRSGSGTALGSVTADVQGNWTYDYTATTLIEGVHAFTATQTANGKTSHHSDPYLVTVDLTAPSVSLTLTSPTYDLSPTVRVTAGDPVGVADNATVTLDVDLNNDLDYLDAGEQGYATGTLGNGYAEITLSPDLAVGSYQVRARVSDLAGNEGSDEQPLTIQSVPNPWQVTASAISTRTDPRTGDPGAHAGRLLQSHALDLDRSPGTGRSGAALVYDSGTVDVRPIVQATVQLDNGSPAPYQIRTQLTWDGNQQAQQWVAIPSGTSPGDLLTVADQVATAVTGVGRHNWGLDIHIDTPTGTVSHTLSGTTFVAANDVGPYGAGWNFNNDRLYFFAQNGADPAGILRVHGGTGLWDFYQDNGAGGYISPVGDNGTLAAGGGGYTYTTPHGDFQSFNAAGMQTGWTSADGNEALGWTYIDADADGQADDVSTMTAIDGAASTFNYTGGGLSGISTVGPRTYAIGQAGGQLTSITDPDSRLRSFSYDANSRMTGEARGYLFSTWGYGTEGALSSAQAGSGLAAAVTPSIVQGLSTAVIGNPLFSSVDGLGNTNGALLDDAGRPLTTYAADGGIRSVTRDAQGRVATETDALGRTTTYARDAQGYVTLITHPDANTEGYTYQAAFHALTSYTDERGKLWSYSYDGSGRLTKETDPLLQSTDYAYYANGLLHTV